MVVRGEQPSHSMLVAMTLHLLVDLLKQNFPNQTYFEDG